MNAFVRLVQEGMMNALRLPKERIDALAPTAIEEHLLAHGWQIRVAASSEQIGVFDHPSHPDEEIVLPRDKGFVDYALRVGEVLLTLAALEQRTAWEMLEAVSSTHGQRPQDGANRTSASQMSRDAS